MADADPHGATLVRQMVMGFRTTQILHAAAKLGIADVLADGSKTSSVIAGAVGAVPRPLYRLLRALASLGIVRESPGERFALTELGETLRSGVPGSVRGLALLHGESWLWSAYGETLHSATTGEPAFDRVHGMSLYEYLSAHPQAAESFDAAMTGYTEQEIAAILDAYDFAGATCVVDVGGGRGALLAAILAAHPGLRGVLLDRDSVVGAAEPLLARSGVADRCSVVPGSFFDAVPSGGDVYVLKSILHNWSDSRSVAILEKCREAMSSASKLLVVERVIPDDDGASEAKLFDINMLVVVGGLERTKREYAAIFDAAGLALNRVVPTRSPMSIVEAVPGH